MSKGSLKRYSAEELRNLVADEGTRTDWDRVRALSEQDLEQSIAGDPDWAAVPSDWTERAKAVMPKPKVAISLRLDADLVDWLRSDGRGWQTRINAILRAYRDADLRRRPTKR